MIIFSSVMLNSVKVHRVWMAGNGQRDPERRVQKQQKNTKKKEVEFTGAVPYIHIYL